MKDIGFRIQTEDNGNDTAIKVEHVSKTFRLPHNRQNSLKGSLINLVKRGERSYEKQEVLKNVSFEIKKGEFFGIVGRNGSGKSTMLKMLAGIYKPTKGKITINGSLTPFIELGVGFNPELTGRENVYLNGALLGFDRHDMDVMYDDIVAFAELERFMDQKLKNYSSGMQVRLAFSIAIRAQSAILILDEVLAVGDASFQRKCFSYFAELKSNGKTVVLVTHEMEIAKKYCSKAIMIEKGRITEAGDIQKVAQAYTRLFIEEDAKAASNKREKMNIPFGMMPTAKIDKSIARIGRVWLEDNDGRGIKYATEENREIIICFEIEALKDVKGIIPGVIVTNSLGDFVTVSNSQWSDSDVKIELRRNQKTTVRFRLPNIYEMGDYTVSVNAVSADLETFLAWKNEVVSLLIERLHPTGGKAYPNFTMEVSYE